MTAFWLIRPAGPPIYLGKVLRYARGTGGFGCGDVIDTTGKIWLYPFADRRIIEVEEIN